MGFGVGGTGVGTGVGFGVGGTGVGTGVGFGVGFGVGMGVGSWQICRPWHLGGPPCGQVTVHMLEFGGRGHENEFVGLYSSFISKAQCSGA